MSEHTETMRRDTREVTRDWTLVLLHGPTVGKHARHLRLQDAVIPIGRSVVHPAGIRIDDPLVSRGGIRLERQEDQSYALIEDGVLNPARVNGTRVRAPRRLEHNDVIRIGDTLLVLELADPTRHVVAKSRQAALLEALGLINSTARAFLDIETRFFDPAASCAAVHVDGFAESAVMAQWLADEWSGELVLLDAESPELLAALSHDDPSKVVFIERIDDLADDALVRVTAAIERRAKRKNQKVGFSYRNGNTKTRLRRLIALTSEATFRIPPLSERSADVLAALRIAARSFGAPADFACPPAYVERLLCYSWPGGLAEVRQVARRVAMQLRDTGAVSELSLPPAILSLYIEPDSMRVSELTHETFEAAWIEYDGCMADIAAHFGYARTYFYRRLRKAGIDPNAVRLRDGVSERRARRTSQEYLDDRDEE